MDPRLIAKAARAGNVIESVLAAFTPGRDGPARKSIRVIPFRSIGDTHTLTVRGRVVRMAPTSARKQDHDGAVPAREHLVAVYRAFDVSEVSAPSVAVTCNDVTACGHTDEGGFFSIDLTAPLGEQWPRGWLTALISLGDLRVPANVFVPPDDSTLAIVSDLDDTAMDSYTTRTWRMLQTVLFRSAHRREAVPGVPALYNALHRGVTGFQANPMCYISSGAWNLYDIVVDYLDVHGLPRGAMFLNDWGSRERTFHTVAYEHKSAHIGALVSRFSALPFLCIGDDVHEDPEMYAMLAQQFPGRVAAIWIRMVRNRAARNDEIDKLGVLLHKVGTQLIMSENTDTFVVDALRRGWISELDAAAMQSTAVNV